MPRSYCATSVLSLKSSKPVIEYRETAKPNPPYKFQEIKRRAGAIRMNLIL